MRPRGRLYWNSNPCIGKSTPIESLNLKNLQKTCFIMSQNVFCSSWKILFYSKQRDSNGRPEKVFVKVVTLDWHDYRCLEQGIMTYIILGLERAFIMGIMLQLPINTWPERPFCDRQSQNNPFSRLYFWTLGYVFVGGHSFSV